MTNILLENCAHKFHQYSQRRQNVAPIQSIGDDPIQFIAVNAPIYLCGYAFITFFRVLENSVRFVIEYTNIILLRRIDCFLMRAM